MQKIDSSALAARIFPEVPPLSHGTDYAIHRLLPKNAMTGALFLGLTGQYPRLREESRCGRLTAVWDGLLARFQKEDTDPKLTAICVVTEFGPLIVDAILIGPMNVERILDSAATSEELTIVANFAGMFASVAIVNSPGFLPLMDQVRRHGGSFGTTMSVIVPSSIAELFTEKLAAHGCRVVPRVLIDSSEGTWWTVIDIPTLDPHPAE